MSFFDIAMTEFWKGAAPFEQMSEAGLTLAQEYLRRDVTIKGVTMSRTAFVTGENDTLREQLLSTVRLVGYGAALNAWRRMERAVGADPVPRQIEYEDVAGAIGTAEKGLTVLCNP